MRGKINRLVILLTLMVIPEPIKTHIAATFPGAQILKLDRTVAAMR